MTRKRFKESREDQMKKGIKESGVKWSNGTALELQTTGVTEEDTKTRNKKTRAWRQPLTLGKQRREKTTFLMPRLLFSSCPFPVSLPRPMSRVPLRRYHSVTANVQLLEVLRITRHLLFPFLLLNGRLEYVLPNFVPKLVMLFCFSYIFFFILLLIFVVVVLVLFFLSLRVTLRTVFFLYSLFSFPSFLFFTLHVLQSNVEISYPSKKNKRTIEKEKNKQGKIEIEIRNK
ncbi:hypothetical protein E2C01_059681 [Portunus trituberculatus]|uniref:Transmembrane protein n=1 Tax=Portunus trituberculatus TaxID=210409 RepID=A0A5B7H9Q6_PORTR|nr:hypothetical protein [Portunus trituberculatus]